MEFLCLKCRLVLKKTTFYLDSHVLYWRHLVVFMETKYEIASWPLEIRDDFMAFVFLWLSDAAAGGRASKVRRHVLVEGLRPATSYQVAVRALNRVGDGPDSEPIFFTTPEAGARLQSRRRWLDY